MLKPGGSLVYAVCSLEPEEGEEIIAAFLARNAAFRPDPSNPGELPGFVTSSPEGWVRVLPGMLEDEGGLDGFFVARLRRS
jgi:16S rRNA (cytosine967-C5)-methyltransferase